MRIHGIAASVPSRRVSNDDIVKMTLEASAHKLGSLNALRLETKMRALFRLAGSENRYFRAPGERSSDFALKAANEALDKAGLKRTDIDLLIYVGVGRGWIEPGMSHYFCDAIGLQNATCFDMLDACLSWMRAMHIAQQFLAAGVYRNIMILNCEFNLNEHSMWVIDHPDELEYRFAQCTIGEAATATIVGRDDYHPPVVQPYFEFHTDASLHRLCKIPLAQIAQYSDTERCPKLDPGVFFSYSTEMFTAAYRMLTEKFHGSAALQAREFDIGFSHAGSKTIIDKLAKKFGASDRTVNIFPEYGNTVSASVPLAMVHAISTGRLQRGMRMMQVVGSAGFSAGFAHLSY